jgi:hypothetical protein
MKKWLLDSKSFLIDVFIRIKAYSCGYSSGLSLLKVVTGFPF